MPARENMRAAGVSRAVSADWAQARKSRGAPSKAIAPESMATTRSAAARQRSRRCSARSTVTPHSSFRRRRSQISSSPATGSSWEVGSSRSTSWGRVTRAAARATRCSSPPERVSTARSSRCGIASASATSSTARARVDGEAPRSSSGSAISAGDRGRDHLGLGVLSDVADVGGELAGAGGEGVDAGHLDPAVDLAAVEVRDQAAGGAQQGRLAAGGAAGEEDQLSGADLERDVAQGRAGGVRVGVGEALDRERRRRPRSAGQLRHGPAPATPGGSASPACAAAAPAPRGSTITARPSVCGPVSISSAG